MPHERAQGGAATGQQVDTQSTTQKTIQNSNSTLDDVDSSDSEVQEDELTLIEQKKRTRHALFGLPNRTSNNDDLSTSTSPKKKSSRCFTFTRSEDELLLLEHTVEEGERKAIQQARFATATEFKEAIEQGDIDGVFRALVLNIKELELADRHNKQLDEDNVALGIQLEEMGGQLAHLNVTSKHEEAKGVKLSQEVAHLRKWKTAYRNEKKEALQRVKDLEQQLEVVKASAREQEEEEEDLDSSDEDALPLRQRQRQRSPVRRTATPGSSVSRPDKSNNKWPDIKDYFGDNERQRAEYPQWRSSIHSKFRNSWDMFSIDQAKIDYVRDKCKSAAFNVVETRADLEGPNPYMTFEEMLQDLDDMFAEHDPMGKADALLHSADFAMKKGERFETFLARFTKVAAVLQMTEHAKIANCKRLLSGRLKGKINDGTSYTSYNELVRRCKQCDTDLFILWGDESKKDNVTTGGGSGAGRGRGSGHRGRSANRSTSRTGERTTTRAAHVITRLKTVGACFKCGERGHMSFQPDAPCKSTPYLSDDAIQLKFHAVEMAELPADPQTGNE
ncbi:hypothetical protein K402DRAFT_426137 [Aulographum hederae CBS 113979]|uniref:CCHC-type domain-containing protein n=1 Tax=Aulographum hederae CBS 113979 TaxID=1176131 RepID=A0A6G1GHX3_9PEZI|nr:hypothetical protein K402DRAFT_426137 [Aulographum hederae CBS 113979]